MKGLVKSIFLLSLVAFCALSSMLAQADIYMKQKQSTDSFSMMGQEQPASESIIEVWMTDNMSRTDVENNSIIVRLDQQKIFIIDHGAQTYIEQPMDMNQMFQNIAQSQGMDDQQSNQFMMMMQNMMKISMEVVPTTETREISGWTCTKYEQSMQVGSMGPSTSEIWATEELEFDTDLYAQASAVMLSMQSGFGQSTQQIIEEMSKIKGVPVLTLTTMSVMGAQINSKNELLEYEEKSAPQNAYEIPAGYAQTDFENMGAGM